MSEAMNPSGEGVDTAAGGPETMPRRRLGASDLEVSVLSLGSWRAYERIPVRAGVDVLRRAREVGRRGADRVSPTPCAVAS